ncbi:MAG TPA: alpha/beta hydrolase [Myxococcota bacterium]|nr:alpha/beta hydrolase [Myxococcota bacterium]
MQPKDLRAKGSQGGELHLLEWSTEGIPMLLLHGFGNEAHIWDDFAPVVAPHYRTLALDHRGHGQSDWDAEGRYELDALVDDVEAVTTALGIERLVLIGHSLGGRVSTLFAGRHPARLAGLVIVDIGPEVDLRGSLRIRQDVETNMKPVFETTGEYARALSLSYPAATPEALRRMAVHGLRPRADGRFELVMDPAWRGITAGRAMAADAEQQEQSIRQRMWDALAALPCPALVVRGAASDILSPEVADRMVDEVLSDGRLAVVPQAGHSVMTDNPTGFNDAVASFVLSD